MGQYFARLDFGTNAPPQTEQRFKSLSRKISASSVPSSAKTAQRNHSQQTEKEIVCGQVQVSGRFPLPHDTGAEETGGQLDTPGVLLL